VTIPDVTGQSEHAAELNIRRRGLDVDSTAVVQEPGIPADQVLAQSPTAKETQVAAPKISFLVSAAPDPPAFVMPSFIGQPLGSASRSLQDAGFKLGNVNVVVPASADAGDAASAAASNAEPSTPAAPQAQQAPPAQPSPASIIVAQVPAAGQKVFAGAAVNFDVR
jgi:beta-lactam-binding protein with PASTA domain